MGLLGNLRVLCGSDIGDRYRRLVNLYEQLVTEFEDHKTLTEARYRRLSKRLRDEPGDNGHEATPAHQSSRVARLVARRAARNSRVPAS